MRTLKYVLPTLLAMAVVTFAAGAAIAADMGGTAPDFSFDSIKDGSTIHLSDNFDKPTVLVFWVSWCPHCRNELPAIQNLSEEFDGKAHFIGVSLDRDVSDALKVVQGGSLTFPNAFANLSADHTVIADYVIGGVPAIFVIDKGGGIKARHDGETSAEEIRGDLASVGVR